MHRFRIDVLGSDAATADAGVALEERGAVAFGSGNPGCWAWSAAGGWDAIADFSRGQASLPLSVQGFQDFQDEMAWAMVTDGEVAVVSRQSVLPSHWGTFHDEDGKPLDREALAWAGSAIAGNDDGLEPSTLFCGLETALVVGGELGRFVTDARDFLSVDAPTQRTLDAIVRLARTALRVGAASRPRSKGELEYLLPLRLTQSVARAGRDGYLEGPGQADWRWWLGILLGAAADLVREAEMHDVIPGPPEASADTDPHQRDPGVVMELMASALVTSCVQALALFGSERRAAR